MFLKHYSRHECLGDIRGSGLIWAIEIVNNKRENKPVSRYNPMSSYLYICISGTKVGHRNNV